MHVKKLIGIFILVLGLGLCYLLISKHSTFCHLQSKTIGLVPFGNISEAEVDSVKSSIKRMYKTDVVILNSEKMPAMAYTTIRYPRYRADSLLNWLTNYCPDTLRMVVGLTNKDISITKYNKGTKEIKEPKWKYKDFGIFGLGRIRGNACIVSSNRLHKNVSKNVFYERLNRIACHEVGHVHGLRHCPNKNCLMNDANESIKTIDQSTGDLCKSCWKKLD